MKIVFEIEDLKLIRKTFNQITSNNIQFLELEFIPKTENWNNGIKTAYIRFNTSVYTFILDETNKVYLKGNIMPRAGTMYISVGNVNYLKDTTERIFYTQKVPIQIVESGKCCVDELPYTPDLYEQVMKKLDEMSIIKDVGSIPNEVIENIVNGGKNNG